MIELDAWDELMERPSFRRKMALNSNKILLQRCLGEIGSGIVFVNKQQALEWIDRIYIQMVDGHMNSFVSALVVENHKNVAFTETLEYLERLYPKCFAYGDSGR